MRYHKIIIASKFCDTKFSWFSNSYSICGYFFSWLLQIEATPLYGMRACTTTVSYPGRIKRRGHATVHEQKLYGQRKYSYKFLVSCVPAHIHGARKAIYSISGLSIHFLLARRTNSQLHALFSLYALDRTQVYTDLATEMIF